ncbi:MAG: hypothetical protein ABI183_07055 [Polyangiaceae bacterium]
MKELVVDVTTERTAQQIAEGIADASSCEDPTRVVLRVAAPRGARKWVAKIFGGKSEHPSRAERGSALVARGYRGITGEIDSAGDDIVRGDS